MHGSMHCHMQFVLYTKKGLFTCHTLLQDCPASGALPKGPKLSLQPPLEPGPGFMAAASLEVGARYCAPAALTNPQVLGPGGVVLVARKLISKTDPIGPCANQPKLTRPHAGVLA